MKPHNNAFDRLLVTFKALSDENRLRMLTLLSEEERNVSELAALLHVKEPTVSHHLTKIREAGLVNMRMDGTKRFYRLDEKRLKQFQQMVQHIDQIRPSEKEVEQDPTWVDRLDIDDDAKKVLRDYTLNQRLKSIPIKVPKLKVVLNWIATHFEFDREYTEAEVNEVLARFHEDFAGLRREMIDLGYMRRERNGRRYWLVAREKA